MKSTWLRLLDNKKHSIDKKTQRDDDI